MADDARWMAQALSLARRGQGRVWPSVSVGCVIVKNGRLIAQGWTQPGGRPHAEAHALEQAGEAARGATAYVTLEPCAHHGSRGGPCCAALVAAGIARVVCAVEDPDPRTSGRGFTALRDAGIEVAVGLGAEEACAQQAGFRLRQEVGRPLFTLKMAISLDGRIATANGSSKWITGPGARAAGHMLRAEHDGIIVGGQTAAMDDPALDCRLPGLADRSPVRIVADSRMAVPLTAQLVRTARKHPTWWLVSETSDSARISALEQAGVEVIKVPPTEGGSLDLGAAAQLLGERGLTSVLAEGGGRLAAGLLSSDLVDRLVVFRAPLLVGGDGIPAVASLGLQDLGEAPRFVLSDRRAVDDDLMEVFTVRR
ncbi:bifunctional diaminohydroxyphosphoribosylaminopyrimidine deaminase/5-amino-6-(5-phosphoribosylamino)uracil reductase RibD [Lacibacterium aquatile]|uniref:Riboflavin biosynthesis protein RibD n=1 Tax=Lacibacterium aquatile TaxID=1168082 RepID=A0ABW5DPP5_9PROT